MGNKKKDPQKDLEKAIKKLIEFELNAEAPMNLVRSYKFDDLDKRNQKEQGLIAAVNAEFDKLGY